MSETETYSFQHVPSILDIIGVIGFNTVTRKRVQETILEIMEVLNLKISEDAEEEYQNLLLFLLSFMAKLPEGAEDESVLKDLQEFYKETKKDLPEDDDREEVQSEQKYWKSIDNLFPSNYLQEYMDYKSTLQNPIVT